jgi:CBS domain-containing protein
MRTMRAMVSRTASATGGVPRPEPEIPAPAPEFPCLREADGLLEALEQMAARGVRRAPIVDRHGHLKGLVSMDDVVPLLARELAKISVLIRREQIGEVRKTEDVLQDEFAA